MNNESFPVVYFRDVFLLLDCDSHCDVEQFVFHQHSMTATLRTLPRTQPTAQSSSHTCSSLTVPSLSERHSKERQAKHALKTGQPWEYTSPSSILLTQSSSSTFLNSDTACCAYLLVCFVFDHHRHDAGLHSSSLFAIELEVRPQKKDGIPDCFAFASTHDE